MKWQSFFYSLGNFVFEHGYVYNYGDSDIIDVTGGNMAVRTQIISQKYEAIIR